MWKIEKHIANLEVKKQRLSPSDWNLYYSAELDKLRNPVK